eukprot:803121-Alexandrium_andersonii.AAC.1
MVAFVRPLTAPLSVVGSRPSVRGAWAISLGPSAGMATSGGPSVRPWRAGPQPRTIGRRPRL